MIKFLETSFNEYIYTSTNNALHPNINKMISFPDEINDLKNIIIFGPDGCGKYTIALNIILKYSNSCLKYDKKMSIMYNKYKYILKLSDIHYEIDFSLLGCNSKLLWHEIFNVIVEIITAKSQKNGILLCKNFSYIHNDLLQVFYTYMQKLNNSLNINIFFIFLTTEISFIPLNIINICNTINIPKPTNYIMNKKINNILDGDLILNKQSKSISQSNTNLKNIKCGYFKNIENPVICKCNIIINLILEVNNNSITKKNTDKDVVFIQMRNNLYDLLTYNLNIYNCLYYIIYKLTQLKKINKDNISDILINVYNFFKFYNNNYRPIYHLEKIIYYIIITI
jgi:hypothetical protein